VTNWASFAGLDIPGVFNIAAFHPCIAARPAVQSAMKEDGLLTSS